MVGKYTDLESSIGFIPRDALVRSHSWRCCGVSPKPHETFMYLAND